MPEITPIRLTEEQAEAEAMFTCNYYQGIGSCTNNCYEEPACVVDAPAEGWEGQLHPSFPREWYEGIYEAERQDKHLKEWLAAEKKWIERDTLIPMTETGIYEVNPLSSAYAHGGRFFGHHRTSGGSSTHRCATREEAQEYLDTCEKQFRRYFEEKLAWRANGSRTPEGKQALVINGSHYIPSWLGLQPNKDNAHKGFGGRIHRWRLLDDPEGTVYETDSLYFQTSLTDEQRIELPDNAEWVGMR